MAAPSLLGCGRAATRKVRGRADAGRGERGREDLLGLPLPPRGCSAPLGGTYPAGHLPSPGPVAQVSAPSAQAAGVVGGAHARGRTAALPAEPLQPGGWRRFRACALGVADGAGAAGPPLPPPGAPCAPPITSVPPRSFVLRGALQVLRLEARGLRGAAPSAALCTRPAGSGTPPLPTSKMLVSS